IFKYCVASPHIILSHKAIDALNMLFMLPYVFSDKFRIIMLHSTLSFQSRQNHILVHLLAKLSAAGDVAYIPWRYIKNKRYITLKIIPMIDIIINITFANIYQGV